MSFPRLAPGDARNLPLVVLAGFGEHEAAEIRALLAEDCRVATARPPRGEATAVLCLGAQLSPIEARHWIAEAGAGPLVVLTAAGPDPAMFQDLIDVDRLFYLSPGVPPPGDLAVLVHAALDRLRAAPAEEPPSPALLQALRTARRVAAQQDLATAGELLRLAAEVPVEADRVYCLLYDPADEVLWSHTSGFPAEERRESSAVGLVSFVARTGRALRVERADEDPRFDRDADDPHGEGHGSLLAVPVREPGAPVLAVLVAVRDSGPFSAQDEDALAVLASTVAPPLAQIARAAKLEAAGGSAPRAHATNAFREEALRHHAAGARDGDWLRLSPRWMNATFWLLSGLAAAFLLFAALSTIDERSSGPAVVRLTGRTEVTANQPGVVTAVGVRPGDRVAAGQILVRFQSAREAAELARIEREWELQLVERLRDLSAGAPAQALIALRAQRDLARARLEERVVRAPRAGIVRDVRSRRDQHVAAGDILLSLADHSSRPVLMALLPGDRRPMLRPGMPLSVELRGYGQAPQRLTIASVADEVVGPDEARRLLGPEVAAAMPLSGPLVRVEASFAGDTFASGGERYALHDGMWGTAEVAVRSESLLAALVPGVRAFLERLHG